MNSYLALAIAIVAEVIGTSGLKTSDGLSRMIPTLVMIVGYACSFYFLSLALRTIPIGLAYAMWAGSGVLLITVAGWIMFGERVEASVMIGLGLIIAGLIIVQLFSTAP
jgi:multidrug transporter EmrE-like cation transporter